MGAYPWGFDFGPYLVDGWVGWHPWGVVHMGGGISLGGLTLVLTWLMAGGGGGKPKVSLFLIYFTPFSLG